MTVVYILIALAIIICILSIIAHVRSNKYELTFDNHYTPMVYKDYPDVEHGNWLPQKHVHDFSYDEKFHYRFNRTFLEKAMLFIGKIVILLIVPLVPLFDGAAIYKGAKKLRQYDKQFKGKYITVSNHVYEYEYLMIRTLNYGKRNFVPIWQEGAEGPSGTLYRSAGGLVLPHTTKDMFYGFKEMKDVVTEGTWLHVFPEQAGWFYYGGVRKFQPGTFRIAHETNTPIIPLGISFRERKGIWRLFGKKDKPCVTISVGDPIYPNQELDKISDSERLAEASRFAVMQLANIKDEDTNNKIKALYNYYPYDASKSSY